MNLGKQQEVLLTRREELVGHLQKVEHELDAPAPKDFEDYSSERQGDEVLESLGHAELAELRRIDAALARIRDGSYGTCVDCGAPISDGRLAVLPDTAMCRTCASQRG